MMEKLFKIIGIKWVYSEYDEMFENMRLKDYGLDDREYISDDNLSNIFCYDPDYSYEGVIKNRLIYEKFVDKYFWQKIKKAHYIYCYALIISILIAIFTIIFFNYYFLGLLIISIVVTWFLRKRFMREWKSFEICDIFLDDLKESARQQKIADNLNETKE